MFEFPLESSGTLKIELSARPRWGAIRESLDWEASEVGEKYFTSYLQFPLNLINKA